MPERNQVTGARQVLVADDDPILLELMAENLSRIGYGVVLVENGELAASALNAGQFDLAIVDINMPKVNGFQLLQRIHSNPETTSLPVILVTSLGDVASIEMAYELGASSFVTKPINWAQFIHHVQFVIRNGQTERDLRAAQAEAAATSRMKNGLFTVLGHELKTPLTALVGLTDVLAKSLGARLNTIDAEYLSHVTDAAQRLNQLVNDVLTLSRALAGPRKLDISENSVAELIDDSLLGLAAKAKSAGIPIRILNDVSGLMLRCDAYLARQALRKLIDNAIKFSPPGTAVEISAAEHAGGTVAVTVRDHGPGIGLTRLRDCLQPFTQGDMTYARPAEGLGLGLPIANAIAEAHGGSLCINTAPGEGLAATLCLPAGVNTAALSA